ncbi:Cysteine protease atg4c [Allomyces javanicus]|nr:Cysteine protease atg4c [Allomyces javanicus]
MADQSAPQPSPPNATPSTEQLINSPESEAPQVYAPRAADASVVDTNASAAAPMLPSPATPPARTSPASTAAPVAAPARPAVATQVQALWSNLSSSARSLLNHVENTIHDFLSATSLTPLPADVSAADEAVLLAKSFPLDPAGITALREELARRPRLTYRSQFSPLEPATFTSDQGWGCMIRVGQSLILEGMLRVRLGRGAVRDASNPDYLEIVQWFRDDPTAPFSIHAIVKKGMEMDTAIGEWFGPTIMAQAMKKNSADAPSIPPIFVAQDAIVFASDMDDLFRNNQGGPVLLLIPLRLGIDALHVAYWPFIKQSFRSPYSIGIAGGRPSSALYMVGTVRDALLVLDPHTTQPAFHGTASELGTIHTDVVRCLAATSLDPSLCLGFAFASPADWTRWVTWIAKLRETGIEVPFSVQAATWVTDENLALSESDSESELP